MSNVLEGMLLAWLVVTIEYGFQWLPTVAAIAITGFCIGVAIDVKNREFWIPENKEIAPAPKLGGLKDYPDNPWR